MRDDRPAERRVLAKAELEMLRHVVEVRRRRVELLELAQRRDRVAERLDDVSGALVAARAWSGLSRDELARSEDGAGLFRERRRLAGVLAGLDSAMAAAEAERVDVAEAVRAFDVFPPRAWWRVECEWAGEEPGAL